MKIVQLQGVNLHLEKRMKIVQLQGVSLHREIKQEANLKIHIGVVAQVVQKLNLTNVRKEIIEGKKENLSNNPISQVLRTMTREEMKDLVNATTKDQNHQRNNG